jgi:hypothetical protein
MSRQLWRECFAEGHALYSGKFAILCLDQGSLIKNKLVIPNARVNVIGKALGHPNPVITTGIDIDEHGWIVGAGAAPIVRRYALDS